MRSHADVTWNDHIPDPDNPTQLRQIDITIRRDGELTIIECRLSRRRQDVKWIEELRGRRESLGAQTIIAVASAGFTVGAQKKAARFGVLLRDLRQLSDEEIQSWGDRVALKLYYYHYADVVFGVGFAEESIPKIDPAVVGQELRSHAVLQSVFNAAASQLDTLNLLPRNDARTVRVGVLVRPEKSPFVRRAGPGDRVGMRGAPSRPIHNFARRLRVRPTRTGGSGAGSHGGALRDGGDEHRPP